MFNLRLHGVQLREPLRHLLVSAFFAQESMGYESDGWETYGELNTDQGPCFSLRDSGYLSRGSSRCVT